MTGEPIGDWNNEPKHIDPLCQISYHHYHHQVWKLTLEEYTARLLTLSFSKVTFSVTGMFLKPGILYVPGPRVRTSPAGEIFCCSRQNNPYP